MSQTLPLIDRHEIAIAAPLDVVWARLCRNFSRGDALGTRTFQVRETAPSERLRLGGRHLFATYELLFELEQTGEQTRLRATTNAQFRAGLGRVYRALVIGSGGHALVVKSVLRRLRRQAERVAATPA